MNVSTWNAKMNDSELDFDLIDKKYRSDRLDNWWPVLAVLFWWAVAIWCFYLILFKNWR